jgi:hypothetical protein
MMASKSMQTTRDGPEDIVLAYIGIKWLDELEDAGVTAEAVVEGLFRAH